MFSPGFVCEFVCEQDNNFQDMSENVKGRNYSIFGVIRITIWMFWIHEM